MKHLKLILTALTLMVASSYTLAESKDPEALAHEYFKVLQNEGMGAVGPFFHPKALEEFKNMLLPIYEAEAESGNRGLINMTFGPSTSIEELRAIQPAAFLNGFMQLLTARTGDTKISFDKLEVLGTVKEGDTHHVLARITVGAGELSITEYEVLSYIPYNGGYGLQLSGELKGMAQAMRNKIQ